MARRVCVILAGRLAEGGEVVLAHQDGRRCPHGRAVQRDGDLPRIAIPQRVADTPPVEAVDVRPPPGAEAGMKPRRGDGDRL